MEISQQNLISLNEELETKVQEKTQQLVRRNKKALKRFLPPEVVEGVLSGKINLQEAPQRQFVTVMFVDLVNFTKSAESLGAGKTASILNQYLEQVSHTIPDPKFFTMQVANDVIPSGFAETASGIWVNVARSPDGPSGLGLTGVNGQKISDPGYHIRESWNHR